MAEAMREEMASIDAWIASLGRITPEIRSRIISAVRRYDKCRDDRPLVHTIHHDDPLTVGDLRSIVIAMEDSALRAAAPPEGVREILFHYINYRGEPSHRRARPISVRWGSSEYHTKPQWLMRATDLAKNEEREFAMIDMSQIVGGDCLSLSPAAAGGETLWGQIAAIYGELDAEDCAWIDREWAKMRGYILPTDGTSEISLSAQSARVKSLEEALRDARNAIAALDGYSLGCAVVEHSDGAGVSYQYPIRDELLAKIDVALLSSSDQIQSTAETDGCLHYWQIWPETDGQEPRCMKCGAPRTEQSASGLLPKNGEG